MPLLTADRVAAVLRRGDPANLPLDAPPRFRVGDRVRARNMHPTGHTRLPRYARGRTGIIVAVHGGFIFPDEHAASGRRLARALYTVRFDSTELWGLEQGERHAAVHADLFESYLEPA